MGGPVESFLEGNSAQNASHHHERNSASALFPSSSSSSNSQVPLSLHIPSQHHHHQSSAQPPHGLGLVGRPLSAGSHLTQHRYSLPSPLPSTLSSSSTPLLPPPTSSPQFNPHFRVQSPFGTPVDPSCGWQIPRGSAPSILTPGFLDYPPRGRELPLPAGFGLAPLAQVSGGNGLGPNGAPGGGAGGYDYLMVSAVRGSAPTNGLGSEFPSAVPPLGSSAGNVLPPFYGGNGNPDSSGPSSAASSTLPPFSAATSAASYSYYGLPPTHPHQQAGALQQQQQPSSAPPSRANSQSRNGTTGSSSSSSPKSLSPGSPIPVGAVAADPFAGGSFKMQLESGNAGEFGSGQGYDFGMGAASAAAVGGEQGQQWA
ncbi:hypothetical protein M407DRAFT_204886 [Tulasnella calospora MUT 4182]|uniref:Uncharacterized protein n=1 Tax=Tulasnella calospora MUT 4182 TaxID=1051891 RepID=A0A0C3QKQ4_9AGAM|nr:hypothetical protein M407DRAFT_204886 [Tulasnella calospora MUT 4182]